MLCYQLSVNLTKSCMIKIVNAIIFVEYVRLRYMSHVNEKRVLHSIQTYTSCTFPTFINVSLLLFTFSRQITLSSNNKAPTYRNA